jgi:chromosome segregation ATPase
MNLKESLKQLKNLADALPAILEMAGPLEQAADIAALESRAEAANRELLRLEGLISEAKNETSEATSLAASARKAYMDMAREIEAKALAESLPRRLALESELLEMKDKVEQESSRLAGIKASVESQKAELESFENRITKLKQDAAKVLGV